MDDHIPSLPPWDPRELANWAELSEADRARAMAAYLFAQAALQKAVGRPAEPARVG